MNDDEDVCWVCGCGERPTHTDLIGVYEGLPVSVLVCAAHATDEDTA